MSHLFVQLQRGHLMLGPVDVVLLQGLFGELVLGLIFGARRLRFRFPDRADLFHLGPGFELGRSGSGRGPEISEVRVVGHFSVFGCSLGDNLALERNY